MPTKNGFEGTYWLSDSEEFFLTQMVSSLPGDYLEVGTFCGIVSVSLAIRFPNKNIHCVDFFQPAHETEAGDKNCFMKNVNKYAVKNIKLFEGDSRKIVPSLTKNYSAIFIDGDHGYETVLLDLRNSWEKLSDDGAMMFHDYGRVEDVTHAVSDFMKERSLALDYLVDSVGCISKKEFDKGVLKKIKRALFLKLLLSPRKLISKITPNFIKSLCKQKD